ncbi:Deoxycytidylate deaminase [Linum perenne]
MNPREVVLVSTATVLGALASALALRFFSSFKPKLSASHSSSNGEAAEKCISQSPFDPSKRKRYLSWDDYFMAIAFLSAERSKDPNRQVGACLVSENGVILGIGYNGFPRGCSDDKLPWAKKSKNGDPLETKYPYVCHAEVNAILNTNHASAAGQSGVTEVIYFVEKNMSSSDVAYVASRKLLSLAGVKVSRSYFLPWKTQFYISHFCQ